MLLPLLVFVLTSSTPAVLQPATVAPAQVARNVRKHLLSLPYYGVFDLITFGVDQNNIVTLGGYVLADTLKKDAEREAREAKGVVEVQNKIEIAPFLPLDDDIRHGVYHAAGLGRIVLELDAELASEHTQVLRALGRCRAPHGRQQTCWE